MCLIDCLSTIVFILPLHLDYTKVIILILWWRNFQLEHWRTFQLVSTASDDLFRFLCNPIDWIAELIQNYEMVVCGNGKLVYLRRKLELDNVLRVRFYDTEEEKRLSPEKRTVTASRFILLYMPQGSDELVELY